MRKVLQLLFLGLILISCNKQIDYKSKAEVVKVEKYIYTVGYSKFGAKGYYKQKIYVKFNYKDSIYISTFIPSNRNGIFRVGDSLIVKLITSPKDIELYKRIPKWGRKKFETVKGNGKEISND